MVNIHMIIFALVASFDSGRCERTATQAKAGEETETARGTAAERSHVNSTLHHSYTQNLRYLYVTNK